MSPSGYLVRLHSLIFIILAGVGGRWDSTFSANNTPLKQRECGKLQKNATEDVWPWIAQIHKWSQDSGMKYVCAGALITGRFVVTTATCVTIVTFKFRPTDRIEIIIGSPALGVGAYHRVQNYKIHRSHKITKIYYDVAVLQLISPLKRVIPICLPETKIEPGFIVTTIGWGVDEYGDHIEGKLATRRRKVVSRSSCVPRKAKFYYSRGITKDLICTRPDNDSHISDDGSPIMILENGRWVLVGLTNWKSSLQSATAASTFAYQYRGWLGKVTDLQDELYL